MRVGVLVLELFLPGCGSLKEKRKIVRSLVDRARARHNVSASEIDHQERHQRAHIAFAAIASRDEPLQRLFDRLIEEAETALPGGVRVYEREILG